MLVCSAVHGSCPNMCSNQGTCDAYSRCKCNTGYQGADCSEAVCPFGPAWSDIPSATDTAHAPAECSNRGTCNRATGQCLCQTGFEGTSCNRLGCPNNCGGNGKCYTMKEKASRTLSSTGVSRSYTARWDADMISGCVCDPRFNTYDCSLRLCPNGDDPLTTGQTNQIQLLKCTATTGSLVLYFLGLPSTTILFSASAAEVRAALLTIPGLTDLKVCVCVRVCVLVYVHYTYTYVYFRVYVFILSSYIHPPYPISLQSLNPQLPSP